MTALPYRAAQYLYNRTLRRILPATYTSRDGIATEARPLDLSMHPPNVRPYKPPGINAIREHVQEGDHVVDIAAGRGVFSALAANRCLHRVDSYDGSDRYLEITRRFHHVTGVDDIVKLHHSIVGDGLHVRETEDSPSVISPSELPEADVLTLDCEGAETSILRGIDWTPRCVIVECHPGYNPEADADTISKCLRDLGLSIESVEEMRVGKHVVVGVDGGTA